MATYQLEVSGQFNATYEYPFVTNLSITNCAEPLKRAMVAGTAADVLLFEKSTTNETTVLILNRSTTNHARIRVAETGGATVDFDLPPSRMLMVPSSGISVSTNEGAFSAFEDWDKIEARGIGGDAEVEILVIEQQTPTS